MAGSTKYWTSSTASLYNSYDKLITITESCNEQGYILANYYVWLYRMRHEQNFKQLGWRSFNEGIHILNLRFANYTTLLSSNREKLEEVISPLKQMNENNGFQLSNYQWNRNITNCHLSTLSSSVNATK